MEEIALPYEEEKILFSERTGGLGERLRDNDEDKELSGKEWYWLRSSP